MSEKATLEQRLVRLASSGIAGPGGRIVRAPGDGALLPRLLSEIAEAVMPRRMRLSAGGGRSITLAAANGRLLEVETADIPGDFADLVGEAFDGGNVGDAEALKAMFEALIGDEDTLLVRQEAMDIALDPLHAGVSAEALAEAWQMPFAVEDSPDGDDFGAIAIDAFLAATQGEVTAWLMTGPETPESEGAGDPDAVEDLAGFAEARRESGEAAKQVAEAKGEPWSFLVLHRSTDAREVTVIVAVDGILLYLALPQDKLAKVADAWRAAVPA